MIYWPSAIAGSLTLLTYYFWAEVVEISTTQSWCESGSCHAR